MSQGSILKALNFWSILQTVVKHTHGSYWPGEWITLLVGTFYRKCLRIWGEIQLFTARTNWLSQKVPGILDLLTSLSECVHDTNLPDKWMYTNYAWASAKFASQLWFHNIPIFFMKYDCWFIAISEQYLISHKYSSI